MPPALRRSGPCTRCPHSRARCGHVCNVPNSSQRCRAPPLLWIAAALHIADRVPLCAVHTPAVSQWCHRIGCPAGHVRKANLGSCDRDQEYKRVSVSPHSDVVSELQSSTYSQPYHLAPPRIMYIAVNLRAAGCAAVRCATAHIERGGNVRKAACPHRPQNSSSGWQLLRPRRDPRGRAPVCGNQRAHVLC